MLAIIQKGICRDESSGGSSILNRRPHKPILLMWQRMLTSCERNVIAKTKTRSSTDTRCVRRPLRVVAWRRLFSLSGRGLVTRKAMTEVVSVRHMRSASVIKRRTHAVAQWRALPLKTYIAGRQLPLLFLTDSKNICILNQP